MKRRTFRAHGIRLIRAQKCKVTNNYDTDSKRQSIKVGLSMKKSTIGRNHSKGSKRKIFSSKINHKEESVPS